MSRAARVLTLARKASAMPPRQLAGIVRTRFSNSFRSLAWKHLGRRPIRTRPLDRAQAGEAASRARQLLLGTRDAELRRWLMERDGCLQRVVARAEDVLAHRTSLLGSDRAPLGDIIDWHRDWVTGTAWPREHFSELDLLKLDEGCDVKRCWDLSRAYHWVWLAQAHWLTRDRRYLAEIETQWGDWLDQNPAEIGVNWANAMEAAIRSVSWWWVIALTAGQLDDRLLARACGSLAAHLGYISRHLEFAGDGRNSNHLLADYVGLSFGGILLADHPSAATWRETGLSGLWRELPRQVYADGVNYEQSAEYHRFILEFFLYTAMVARRAGHEAPAESWARIERMLDVCMHTTRPDGLANAIGDGDDGRLFWLTERQPLDFRGVLGVGAAVFGRGDFKWVAGAVAVEDVAWVMGVAGVEAFEPLPAAAPAETTVAFPEGGLYIARSGWTSSATHAVIDAGYLGMGPEGRGSHGHADTLSFCLSMGGQPVLIDPGTGIYTGNAEWRNAFRSGQMHNGVTVDGQGVCAFDDGLFRWSSLCTPVVERWQPGRDWTRFAGSHDGFERIAAGARHRRAIWISAHMPAVVVNDRIAGGGRHAMDVWYQFRAGLDVAAAPTASGTWVGPRQSGECGVLVPRGARAIRLYRGDESEGLGWTSPSYGARVPATTLRITAADALPIEMTTIVAPFDLDPAALLPLARENGDTELETVLARWT